MNILHKDVIIIGGGPSGLAAAIALYEQGIKDIMLIERERHLGGILRQCIHDGFGLTLFSENISGPEYAGRLIDRLHTLGVPYVTDTAVLSVSNDKTVQTVSRSGLFTYRAKAVILAMGCRERTAGAIAIPGERPAGVYTAGVAQHYMNLQNIMVGKEVVILGSGDIGMIMARRLTLEGARVQAVLEIMPYPGGLSRNVLQCLEDYDIPLLLSHTVTDIHGGSRLTGVTVSKVDENYNVIEGSERRMDCDTLILSVGLIPENELSTEAGVTLDQVTGGAVVDEHGQTSVPGIFAAGNVLHVHDLADYASLEARRVAAAVYRFIHEGALSKGSLKIIAGKNVRYTVPHAISGQSDVTLSLRVKIPLRDCQLEVRQQGTIIFQKKLNKALPAEMIEVALAQRLFVSTSALEVRVC